jgi:hypothetical protein
MRSRRATPEMVPAAGARSRRAPAGSRGQVIRPRAATGGPGISGHAPAPASDRRNLPRCGDSRDRASIRVRPGQRGPVTGASRDPGAGAWHARHRHRQVGNRPDCSMPDGPRSNILGARWRGPPPPAFDARTGSCFVGGGTCPRGRPPCGRWRSGQGRYNRSMGQDVHPLARNVSADRSHDAACRAPVQVGAARPNLPPSVRPFRGGRILAIAATGAEGVVSKWMWPNRTPKRLSPPKGVGQSCRGRDPVRPGGPSVIVSVDAEDLHPEEGLTPTNPPFSERDGRLCRSVPVQRAPAAPPARSAGHRRPRRHESVSRPRHRGDTQSASHDGGRGRLAAPGPRRASTARPAGQRASPRTEAPRGRGTVEPETDAPECLWTAIG